VLAILTQESNLGQNVGQCYLRDNSTGAGVGKNTGTVFQKVMSPTRMKTETHPTYFPEAKGHLRMWQQILRWLNQGEDRGRNLLECHPFYTGNDKIMDTAGRVEKFKARRAAATTKTKKSK
jgi:large subunit ribosomal protein L31